MNFGNTVKKQLSGHKGSSVPEFSGQDYWQHLHKSSSAEVGVPVGARDAVPTLPSLRGWRPSSTTKAQVSTTTHGQRSDLLLQYLGLCIVVNRFLCIGESFGATLDVRALKDNTGTAGQHQLLPWDEETKQIFFTLLEGLW